MFDQSVLTGFYVRRTGEVIKYTFTIQLKLLMGNSHTRKHCFIKHYFNTLTHK